MVRIPEDKPSPQPPNGADPLVLVLLIFMPLLLAYSLASWFLDGDESSESQKDGTPATTTTTLSPAEEFVEVLEDSAVIVNFELPDGTKVECLISDENERKDVYQYHTEDILGCNWDKVEK